MPTSKVKRVRSESFSKIIAKRLPLSSALWYSRFFFSSAAVAKIVSTSLAPSCWMVSRSFLAKRPKACGGRVGVRIVVMSLVS